MSKPAEIEIAAKYPIRDISLSMISTPPRMRKLRPGKVEELAESMKRSSLLQPILVRPRGAGYELVAGQHRLSAGRKLRWKCIKCHVFDDLDDVGAALLEIDENLIRADLTKKEKREHLIRRKELWEKRQAEQAKESGAWCVTLPKTGRGNKGFAADTAATTGMSKSQINRLLAEPKPRPKPELTPALDIEPTPAFVAAFAEVLGPEVVQALAEQVPVPAMPALEQLEKPMPASAAPVVPVPEPEPKRCQTSEEVDRDGFINFLGTVEGVGDSLEVVSEPTLNLLSKEQVADAIEVLEGTVASLVKMVGRLRALMLPDPGGVYAGVTDSAADCIPATYADDGKDLAGIDLGDIPACLDRRRQ